MKFLVFGLNLMAFCSSHISHMFTCSWHNLFWICNEKNWWHHYQKVIWTLSNYICDWVCVNESVCLRMSVCAPGYTQCVSVCLCGLCAQMHVCMDVYVCVHLCILVSTRVWVFMWIRHAYGVCCLCLFICVSVGLSVSLCGYTHVHFCTCWSVCVYMCVWDAC